ncbi:MAG: aminotransferase class I/II-fold pyridoxal phosphate-dependent enzyme, partial [Longispora sp.]|nr:aminotransferase class I/II-fold pyridoxal phosphate-dependent enzyme [Longispora sp. (in: high G+C Gram-positive bacteria)]
ADADGDGTGDFTAADGPVSAAVYVDDVDSDDVVIFDGLTKNFRYPGWRLGWAVGPRHTIATLEKVGIALDGGPSNIVQRAALLALDPAYADQETSATRRHFTHKRNLTVNALRDMGITAAAPTQGTCYVWGCLDELPGGLSDAATFFRAGLEYQVITVPGQFFDINPGRRRDRESYTSWIRFSFGPAPEALTEGLNRLAQMIEKYR